MKPFLHKPVNRDHLEYLHSADMFDSRAMQIFSAKTGIWLGTIYDHGRSVTFEQEPEPEEISVSVPDPNQLTLF